MAFSDTASQPREAFVADESVDRQIANRIRGDGHEVVCVSEIRPGIPDEAVLALANERHALLVTADRDFGELVFRRGRVTEGVVLVRLEGLSNDAKASTVAVAIRRHFSRLRGSFVVIAPGQVRIRPAASSL